MLILHLIVCNNQIHLKPRGRPGLCPHPFVRLTRGLELPAAAAASQISFMGCFFSTPVGPLEAKLIQAVKDAKAKRKSKTTFNHLLLSFHKLHGGFIKINELLNSFHDDVASASTHNVTGLKGKVRFSELARRLEELRMDPENTLVAQSLQALKSESAAISNQAEPVVDLDEFLIFWTVIHLGDCELVKFPEIQASLFVIENAFNCFDSSNDGLLERKELAAVMRPEATGHPHAKRVSHGIKGSSEIDRPAAKLFKHFDLDRSGSISFKEFLLGIFTIVMDEEIEQEETEASRASAGGVRLDGIS